MENSQKNGEFSKKKDLDNLQKYWIILKNIGEKPKNFNNPLMRRNALLILRKKSVILLDLWLDNIRKHKGELNQKDFFFWLIEGELNDQNNYDYTKNYEKNYEYTTTQDSNKDIVGVCWGGSHHGGGDLGDPGQGGTQCVGVLRFWWRMRGHSGPGLGGREQEQEQEREGIWWNGDWLKLSWQMTINCQFLLNHNHKLAWGQCFPMVRIRLSNLNDKAEYKVFSSWDGAVALRLNPNQTFRTHLTSIFYNRIELRLRAHLFVTKVTHPHYPAKSSQIFTKLSEYFRIGLLSLLIICVCMHKQHMKACTQIWAFSQSFWPYLKLCLPKMKKITGATFR